MTAKVRYIGRFAACQDHQDTQRESNSVKRIVVQTPARLHIGLLDLNGEIGRIDGGIGLALESPHTSIEAVRADGVQVNCAAEPEIEARLSAAVQKVCERYQLSGARVSVLAPFLPVRRRWVEDIATRVSDCITPGFCGCVKTMKSKALQSRSSISSYRF